MIRTNLSIELQTRHAKEFSMIIGSPFSLVQVPKIDSHRDHNYLDTRHEFATRGGFIFGEW